MCGISGFINLNGLPVKDTGCILSMLDVQKHRGPDDNGLRAFNLNEGDSVGISTARPVEIEGRYTGILGFNRLSILDLSMNGHQPMMSPDGKVLLTLNGEIYNAFGFKPELEAWGYRFKSTSDTEVLLALYLKYGFTGMLMRLNGMFAIVIADLGLKQLFIARDRFGIKPMYYHYIPGKILAFSSELKSFKYLEGFRYSLAEEKMDEYMLFRNNTNGTLFREVESLNPGHYLCLDGNQKLSTTRFFSIEDYRRDNNTSVSLQQFVSNTEEYLSRSVKSQLMSDVKLGCQLSGGIDSSLVTWLANRNAEQGSFESVSIVFNDPRFNEEKYIDQLTSDLDVTAHKFLLDSDYYFDHFEKACWHLESPVNHPNTIAIYKLSQRAKEYVTVLLSGEGADEVFGGYSRFYDITYPFRTRKLAHEARKSNFSPGVLLNYLKQDYRGVMATAYVHPLMAGRIKQNFSHETATRSRLSIYNGLTGTAFDKQVKYEILTYLPDLLIRQDKMSMAHSIENRVPFLDNELVEFSFTIPEKYLMLRKSPEGFKTEKYLLKKMIAGRFGNEFAFRDKMGFGIPLREFFSNKKFNDYIREKLVPGIKQRGIMNGNLAADWTNNLASLRYDELEALWVMLSFETFASIYLDLNYADWNSSHR